MMPPEMKWVIELLSSLEEINAVLAVEEASFSNPWSREMYLAELENKGVSFCFVAKDEHGRVAGFCSFWHVLDELHINNLAVLPEFRRAGIAASLLKRVLKEGAALGARRATLEVRRSNDPARLLYERFGFSIASVRRAYYTKPVEDALVLWREDLGDGDQQP
jgi:ribosomal-protein-alanine N-acetyltransferase